MHQYGSEAKKVYSSPNLLFRYDFPAAATSGTHTFAAGTWRDFPDLTHTPTLTKASTILLVHYQISYSIGVSADSMGVSANGDVPMLQIDGRRHRRDLSAVDRRRWRIRHLLGDVDRRDHGRRQPRDQGAVPQQRRHRPVGGLPYQGSAWPSSADVLGAQAPRAEEKKGANFFSLLHPGVPRMTRPHAQVTCVT